MNLRVIAQHSLLMSVAACSQPAAMHEPQAVPHEEADAGPPKAVAEAGAEAPTADAGAQPLTGEAIETWQLEDLEVVVAIPVGATEKRPIVVGVHGAADRPELACTHWQETLAAFAFVVCPKGVPHRHGLAWGAPSGIAERAERAVAALRARYGAYVADGPVTYAGWSLGGTLGPAAIASRPNVYDRAILVEVGHTRLDARKAAAHLKTGGVSRVIVSCATRRCLGFAKRLEHEWGAGMAINDGGIGRGHLFDAEMYRTLARTMVANVDGDARWIGFAEAVAAKYGRAP